MKIYVPSFTSNSCVVVLDKDTIRVYDNQPLDFQEVNYTDYYINSHYLSKSGSIVYGDSSFIDSCISNNDLTSDSFYRNDIDSILIIFFILTIFCIYFPYKIFSRAFGRWFKL